MNLKKIVAAVAAAAVAVSAMAVNAFAVIDTTNYMKEGDANGTVFVRADKEGDPNLTADTGIALDTIYGVKYYVEFGSEDWIGGGIGANSQSTGWLSNEWATNAKPIVADVENGTITWLLDKPVFAESDTYCQFWIQTWSGTLTVKSADILDANGNVIEIAAAPAEEATEAPAEEATEETTEAAEEEAAVEEEAAEEETAEEVVEEEIVEEEIVEEVEEEVVEEVVEEAPAADTTTEATETGNVAVASIAAVMALAGAAAVVAKKRN
ncbi:MAG: hypothetical protein IJC04_02580 [Oscillospiraceae bacterium]|nr:hypothetical protein [Oscillospiraceae bacterium]